MIPLLPPRERLGGSLPGEGVDSGLNDMGMVRVPTIPSVAECEEEFSKMFYSNVDKRLMETQKIPNYRPLFKTTQEALEIIALISTWDETGSGKRKCVHHTRQEYRIWKKYEVVKGGVNKCTSS
jgi:hypothetical protein